MVFWGGEVVGVDGYTFLGGFLVCVVIGVS